MRGEHRREREEGKGRESRDIPVSVVPQAMKPRTSCAKCLIEWKIKSEDWEANVWVVPVLSLVRCWGALAWESTLRSKPVSFTRWRHAVGTTPPAFSCCETLGWLPCLSVSQFLPLSLPKGTVEVQWANAHKTLRTAPGTELTLRTNQLLSFLWLSPNDSG